MKLKFYKDHRGWWISLPEYIEAGGDPDNLAMVAGADDFLDYLSDEGTEIELVVKEEGEAYLSRQRLERVDEIPTQFGKYYKDFKTKRLMWLCDVVLFVFNNEFPETIWYKKL